MSEPVRLASPPRGDCRLPFDAQYEAIVERAFALAETGRFASLASLKQQLKREGFVAVETALRGTHDRRELRALCRAAQPGPTKAPRPLATRPKLRIV